MAGPGLQKACLQIGSAHTGWRKSPEFRLQGGWPSECLSCKPLWQMGLLVATTLRLAVPPAKISMNKGRLCLGTSMSLWLWLPAPLPQRALTACAHSGQPECQGASHTIQEGLFLPLVESALQNSCFTKKLGEWHRW